MNATQSNWRTIAGAAAVTLFAGLALAQTPCPAPDNCITNPSFEDANPFNAAEPAGWHNLSSPANVRLRTLTDGLTPPAVVRTGQASLELNSPPSATDFRGATTDTVNFFAAGFPFYDPAYDWSSATDIRISGWYYIPSNDPITGQVVGIKVNAKSGSDAPAANRNQDWATLDPWGGEAPTISGHTNNEWMYYEAYWSFADLETEVSDNADLGFFPYPQYSPGRFKLTIGRWSPDAGVATGTIFWDDIKIEYVSSGPICPACAADYDGNGGVDGGDLAAFFTDFEAGEACADVDGNGGVDGGDLGFFFMVFEQGGCE